MSEKETYGAQAIAEDLENLGEEIATDTEMTLTETKPEDFDHDEWKALREAIKAMREKLDAMEEMIERAETEAEEYDEETAEDRYETYWALISNAATSRKGGAAQQKTETKGNRR